MKMLFDACTAINLLHIDEDEFLLKKVLKLDFLLCKAVFDEINKNVFNKFTNIVPYPAEAKKAIEIKLINFRHRIYSDEDYLSFADEIAEQTGYPKVNGEFHSTLLAMYINTFEDRHILFFTDDMPAKDEFLPYYNHNRIGYIEDSVDLLVLLYRRHSDFSKNDLVKYLGKLYSEYVQSIAAIQKAIEGYEIPKSAAKNQKLRKVRDDMRMAISEKDVKKLQGLYLELLNNSKEYDNFISVFTKYDEFFKQNISREYLEKIKETLSHVGAKPFFKFAC